MPKVRVLVANSSKLMRELVLAILENQPGIEILESGSPETFSTPALIASIEKLEPDFLIATLDEEGHEQRRSCESLLRRFPELKILALARHSDRCILYRVNSRVYATAVVMSEEGILGALREKTSHRQQSKGRTQADSLRKAS